MKRTEEAPQGENKAGIDEFVLVKRNIVGKEGSVVAIECYPHRKVIAEMNIKKERKDQRGAWIASTLATPEQAKEWFEERIAKNPNALKDDDRLAKIEILKPLIAALAKEKNETAKKN